MNIPTGKSLQRFQQEQPLAQRQQAEISDVLNNNAFPKSQYAECPLQATMSRGLIMLSQQQRKYLNQIQIHK